MSFLCEIETLPAKISRSSGHYVDHDSRHCNCMWNFFHDCGCIENSEIFLAALSTVSLALLLILHSMVYDVLDISMYVIKCIAWVVHICWQVSFKQAFNVGKISDYPPGYRGLGHVDVQCFPLYSYLLALNRTKVDYFSLDVEGSELDVLRTIPFEKLDIRVRLLLFLLVHAHFNVELPISVLHKFAFSFW